MKEKDMAVAPTDMSPERCAEGVDNDGDGLDNACECKLRTNLDMADTDGDGLSDFEEDANHDCVFGIGEESDPRQADTDADGANDKEEKDAGTNPIFQDTDNDGIKDGIEIHGCTNPLEADSDSDNLPDGVEDGNQDGELGTCVNRVFDSACAQGESDPCKADTDGDGTPDSDEAQYRACRPEDTQNLPTAITIDNASADFKIVISPSVTSSAVTGLDSYVFEDSTNKYTGFVLSFNPSQTNPAFVEDSIIGNVQGVYATAARRVSGRNITSHDGFKASVGSIIDLPNNLAPNTARDQILASLAGSGSVSHTLNTGFVSNGTTLMVSEVLVRSATQAIIISVFVNLNDYQNDALQSGILIDDLTRGPSLAKASETVVTDCVAYDITVRPKVDIIISLDASGSMIEEQMALTNFSNEFTTLLNGANIDWRVGVTSVQCSEISTDNAVDAQFRALFLAGGFVQQVCHGGPFGGIGGGTKNGQLLGNFTTDPVELARKLNDVDGTAAEYTATMAIAAMVRATPRSEMDLSKLRPDASVILISITDEEDEFFKTKHRFLGGSNLALSAADQATLDMGAQPFVDFMLKPEFAATMFGLYWLPGEACGTGADVAHAVNTLVQATGGGGGSICQVDITNTLAEIANATAGIASGLRLRGTPLTTTLNVLRANAANGNIGPLSRSRADGFDFDAIVNRIAFTGPSTPQTHDRVVIPYRRWEHSISVCMSDADCPSAQKLLCVEGECR